MSTALAVVTARSASADPADTPGIDAGAMTWGDGSNGALGDGAIDGRLSPALYAGPNVHFTKISMSNQHALALAQDGTVWAWGDNSRKQVLGGLNAPLFYSTPVQIPNLNHIADVAAGGVFSIAVGFDGSVYQWGEDLVEGNNVGGPGVLDIGFPQLVSGIGGITRASAYATHALLLGSDGSVYGWGDNFDGVLGNGNTDRRAHPTKIGGLPPATVIATGLKHSLVAGNNGLVYAFGDNSSGQLGLGSTSPSFSTVPRPVLGLSSTAGISQLAAGFSHSVALLGNGVVDAWGDNTYGQLGNGSTGGISTLPVQVQNLSGVSSIAAGSYANLAVVNRTVSAWGLNLFGQLGDGTTQSRSVPQPVPGLSFVDAIAMGSFTSAASVLSPASLFMALSPSSATVNGGGSAITTISFTASRGVAGNPVNLSVSGLPAGVTASFANSSPDPSTTTTLTLTTSPSTTAGTYPITVAASAGTPGNPVAQFATFSLTVTPSFALALSPAQGSVVVGSWVSTQVSLTTTNGFTGSAVLSVNGLPTGVAASFNPPTVSATAPSTLSLSASGSAAPGVYQITVTATHPTAAQPVTVTYQLTVPTPAFTIGLNPAAGTASAGSTAVTTVSLTPINGFTGTAALVADGAPAGITVSFAAATVSDGNPVGVTVTAASTVPAGVYPVTIRATGGPATAPVSATATFTLTVTPVFTLGLNPGQAEVVAGGTAATQVTLSSPDGFTGPASVAVSGVPDGVTATFTPSVSAGSPATVGLHTTLGSPVGSFTIVVTATSEAVGHPVTASYQLTIDPPPSFTIAPGQAQARVIAGDAVSTAVSLVPLHGFTGAAVLSATGLPAGATATFSPGTVSAGTAATATLSTSDNSPAGDFPVTITAVSAQAQVTQSTVVDLVVAPSFSVAFSPGDGTIIASGSVTSQVGLSSDDGFTGSATIAVTNLPDGTTVSLSTTQVRVGSAATLTLTSAGTPSGTYDIHVTATSSDGTQTRDGVFELTISGMADRGDP
jgi:alpha-tubulin suppressor-like RCC1 family protein/uncharacterized membrane protein